MTTFRLVVVCVIGGLVGGALGTRVPSDAASPLGGADALRPVFSHLLGDPPTVRVDAVPDARAGDYTRISLYAEHAVMQGMRIDQLWIRLLGARVDAAALQRGTLKVLAVKDSAIYGRLGLKNVQDFLNHESAVRDVTLSTDGDSTTVVGTVVYHGVPTRVQMQGAFQVNGAPQVLFHIRQLVVDSLPMPSIVADQFEQQINPVIDLRSWPVSFPIRSFRATGDVFVLTSQADDTQPCEACGGMPVQPNP